LLVGTRASADARGSDRQTGQQLREEARFPHPSFALYVHGLATATERLTVEREESAELIAAANDLREASRARAPLQAEDAIHRYRLGLAFDRDGLWVGEEERVTGERVGGLADQDTAGRRHALDALRRVHRVTGHRVREHVTGEQPGDDLAGVDPDADRD